MKAMLIPVGWNELLDFVRHNHSALADLSPLIPSFNVDTAAWRFKVAKQRAACLCEAQSIQHQSALKNNPDAQTCEG
jgi:hypothetical protein